MRARGSEEQDMTAITRIQRELTKGQRRAVAAGESVNVTGTAALPESCGSCLDWFTYWLDSDGIWSECGCDAGYM
jgi:hypothetical protein